MVSASRLARPCRRRPRRSSPSLDLGVGRAARRPRRRPSPSWSVTGPLKGEPPSMIVALAVVDQGLGLLGDHGAERRLDERVVTGLEADPEVAVVLATRELAGQDRLDDVGVHRAPVPLGAGDPALGGKLRRVGVVADRHGAGRLGGLDDRLGAVLVLGDDVDALVRASVAASACVAGVAPVGGEDDGRRGLRVHRLRTRLEGVDVGERLRDREGVRCSRACRSWSPCRRRCRPGTPARTPCRSRCRRCRAWLVGPSRPPWCTNTTSGCFFGDVLRRARGGRSWSAKISSAPWEIMLLHHPLGLGGLRARSRPGGPRRSGSAFCIAWLPS